MVSSSSCNATENKRKKKVIFLYDSFKGSRHCGAVDSISASQLKGPWLTAELRLPSIKFHMFSSCLCGFCVDWLWEFASEYLYTWYWCPILYYSLMLSVRQIGTKSTVTQFWTKSLQKMNKWIAACWWQWSHHGEGKWMAFNWLHSYYQLFTLSHNINLWYYTVLDLYHFIVWMLYLVFPGNSTQWSAFMRKSELKKRQICYLLTYITADK